VGGSLACVQATRQGHEIGEAEPEAEVEFSEQFSCPSKRLGPMSGVVCAV